MTEEQIIQLVKEHFKYGGLCDDGSWFKCKYYGDLDTFVKFAQEIYMKGWDDSRSATKFAISFDEHLGY
jgi:hypothetical protein